MEMTKNGQQKGKKIYKEILLMLDWELSYCTDQCCFPKNFPVHSASFFRVRFPS